jgi:sialic acid synthase SpsE
LLNNESDQTTYDYLAKLLDEYPIILEIEDIKKILRLGKDSAYKLMKQSNFPSFKVGASYKITKPNLIKYLCQQEV